MKTWLIGALIVAIAATATPTPSEARRLGGGKSTGMQRSTPTNTPPAAAPAQPATPAPTQQAAPAQSATPAAAPKRSWMGPLAGLAAGLGIAALLSHFGMGEAASNFLMMALLAAAAVFAIGWLLRRFGPQRAPVPAMAGAGSSGWIANNPSPRQDPVFVERVSTPVAALEAPAHAPAAATSATAPALNQSFVPASFDAEGFARTAKLIFIRMQAANDTADLDDLRRFTTPELFAEIRLELQERGAVAQQTDVVKVDATVLDVANEAERQIVSVRFQGQVIETKGAAPTDFNEVWHLVKPHQDGGSWAIAGIEQAH